MNDDKPEIDLPDMMARAYPEGATPPRTMTTSEYRQRVVQHMTRSSQELLLHAGEMTAQELRTVKAVLTWLRETLPQPEAPETARERVRRNNQAIKNQEEERRRRVGDALREANEKTGLFKKHDED